MGTQTLPKPDITFVIPTKNNEITIDACIKSLQNQKNVNVEIIVVDNHSTDNTAKIAKNNNVTVIVGGPERCSQRNIGTLNANSNIVAFIDSDMVAKPQIGTEAVKLLNTHTNWAGLIIPEYSFGEGFWTKCKALEKSLYVGDTTVEAGRIWRKNELMQAGGWNENLIAGEDWELTERMLNYKKQTHPNATMGRTNEYIGHNEGRLSLKGTYQKKRYYGQFLGKYMKEGGSKHLKRTSLLNSKLLKHPIEGTGVVILKTVEAVGIGVGALTAKKENPATVAPSKNAEITVAHIIGEYSVNEVMGRTINEIATRINQYSNQSIHNKIITAKMLTPGDIEDVVITGGDAKTGLWKHRNIVKTQTQNVDIVHVHGGSFSPSLIAKLNLNKPTIVSVYATPNLPTLHQWRQLRARHWFKSNAGNVRVIASHLFGKKSLTNGLKKLKVKAILTPDPRIANITGIKIFPYNAGATHLDLKNEKAKWCEDNQKIVFVGRAELVRGIEPLLEAFTVLKRKHPNLTLELALLPAADTDIILNLVNTHPYSEDITVSTHPANVYETLASSTVGVWAFLSDYVTSPPSIAALEALAVGLPIVVSDVSCLNTVVTEGNYGYVKEEQPGALCRVGNINDIVTAVSALLDDETLWKKTSENALMKAKKFNWEEVAQTTAAAYQYVLTNQTSESEPQTLKMETVKKRDV